jgi:hypothetical protein
LTTKLNYLTGKGKSSSHFWHCQKIKLDFYGFCCNGISSGINNLGAFAQSSL